MSAFYKSWGFISVLLQMFSRGCSLNVAFNKQSSYCNKPLTLNKMSDGIKTLTNFERYTEPCVTISHVKINLGGTYAVHYIIVFEGEGNDAGQLDFFTARLSDTICSEYPGRANLVNKSKGLRVNCANRKDVYSNVGIYSLKNIGFTITEIEVHILGLTLKYTLIPLGCFGSFGVNKFNLGLEACVDSCTSEQFVFAGIKNNNVCGCSNDLNRDDEISFEYCYVTCSGKDCDGIESYSVFLIASVLPYYEGCLRTSEDFIMNSISRGNMTIAKCLRLCENRRYAYLQSGDHCICQDTFSKSKVLPGTIKCPTSCTGDAKMTCGGDDEASVYATCLSEKMSLPCSKLFNCKDSYDMYGNCEGACGTGYYGEQCLERVYERTSTSTIHPFACKSINQCLDQPNTICILVEERELCECIDGYSKGDDREEECEDVDECRFHPCDITASHCINLNGSYRCECKSGFIRLTEHVCLRNETGYEEGLLEMGVFLFFVIPMVSMMITVVYFLSKVPLSTESRATSFTMSARSSAWSR